MTNTTVTIRVDRSDKERAAEIADYFGFDLSSVTRAFYKQMIRENCIPLDLRYSNEEPNDETIAAMKEAEEMIAKGGTGRRFKSAEDMIAFIESETDE